MASAGTDPSVQGLCKAINTLDSELQAKFDRFFFENTGRCPEPRDMIMGLPMLYGWMVFWALELRAQVAENPDELHRELVLLCTLRWQALHDQVNAVSNPTGYMEGNTLDMPRNIEDRPQWYEQVYNHIVQPKACWTDPAVDANINLEMACREGKFSETDRSEIPPWREWQRRSKNKTGEEPGLLARLNLPQLIGGNFDDSSPNYDWVPPLQSCTSTGCFARPRSRRYSDLWQGAQPFARGTWPRIVSSVPLVCHDCDTPPGVPFSRHSTYTNEHLEAAP
jgi:hypothetical protein